MQIVYIQDCENIEEVLLSERSIHIHLLIYLAQGNLYIFWVLKVITNFSLIIFYAEYYIKIANYNGLLQI